MSRPKGSKNRKTLKKIAKAKIKSPRKLQELFKKGYSLNNMTYSLLPSNMTKSKFLGYCPKCELMISKRDLESRFVFKCKSCGKKYRTKYLITKKESANKDLTKKEYITAGLNAEYHDMPAIENKEHHNLQPIHE